MSNGFINLDNPVLCDRLVNHIKNRVIETLRVFSEPMDNGRFIGSVDWVHLNHEVLSSEIKRGIREYFEEGK